jgi:hypothetical protein
MSARLIFSFSASTSSVYAFGVIGGSAAVVPMVVIAEVID